LALAHTTRDTDIYLASARTGTLHTIEIVQRDNTHKANIFVLHITLTWSRCQPRRAQRDQGCRLPGRGPLLPGVKPRGHARGGRKATLHGLRGLRALRSRSRAHAHHTRAARVVGAIIHLPIILMHAFIEQAARPLVFPSMQARRQPCKALDLPCSLACASGSMLTAEQVA